MNVFRLRLTVPQRPIINFLGDLQSRGNYARMERARGQSRENIKAIANRPDSLACQSDAKNSIRPLFIFGAIFSSAPNACPIKSDLKLIRSLDPRKIALKLFHLKRKSNAADAGVVILSYRATCGGKNQIMGRFSEAQF